MLLRLIALRLATSLAIAAARSPRVRRALIRIDRAIVTGCLVYRVARLVLARAAVRVVGDDPSEFAANLGFILLIAVICGWCVGLGGRP